MTNDELLDLPMHKNDAGAKTIREYFGLLLAEIWRKKEGFSGKRPFGNSGWEYDIFRALAKGGAIKCGEPDGADPYEDYLNEIDDEEAGELVKGMIAALIRKGGANKP